MRDSNQQVLFREMILDLHYRFRLADELFCKAAESFVAAAAEDWEKRSTVIQNLREYSQALQIINQDFCRIVKGQHAVFPAELAEWVYDLPDGEIKVQLYLERLRAIAEGEAMAVNRELLHMEFNHE